MGTYRRRKHTGEEDEDKSSLSDDNQKRLSSYGTSSISKSDAKDFLIPILKEIGKCLYPPAAPIIEAAYQAYKHANAIKKVGSAVISGDYDKAARVIMKEGVKEVAGTALGAAIESVVGQSSEVLQEEVKANLADKQSKEIAGKVVKGTVKGVAEAASDKFVDSIADGVFKNEQGHKKARDH